MIDSTPVKAHRSAACAKGGKTGCGPFARKVQTKSHAFADAKERLIAILLTGGEAHDCPVADRLFRRVKPPQRPLGDKAYDSAELREELDERGTKPVLPNRCNRKQSFSFSKRLYIGRCGSCPLPAPARWCRRHGCAQRRRTWPRISVTSSISVAAAAPTQSASVDASR
jgi:transposase